VEEEGNGEMESRQDLSSKTISIQMSLVIVTLKGRSVKFSSNLQK